MKQHLTLSFMECSDLLLALHGRMDRLENEIRASADAKLTAIRADDLKRVDALYNKIASYQKLIY